MFRLVYISADPDSYIPLLALVTAVFPYGGNEWWLVWAFSDNFPALSKLSGYKL